MRVKTFQGRSLEEVLPQIKAELGARAVVIGQRTKVQGGVAGFFGTRVIEVTAADSMPTDSQLVDLEDQLMEGGAGHGDPRPQEQGQAAPRDEQAAALADRFAGAMRMGRRGGIDVTDEWDPSQDAELAQEYGRVLEHAAAAATGGGFTELDVPVVTAAPVPAPAAPAADPLAQAHALAQRTHEQVRRSTQHVDEQLYAPQSTSGTYAPPQALPRTTPAQERARTFAASVLDTPMQAYEPEAITRPDDAAHAVDAALRGDLGLAASVAEVGDAIDAAVELIDRKAEAALRNAAEVSRRMQQHAVSGSLVDAQTDHDVARITSQLSHAGVDDDVIESLVDTAMRHRRPFGATGPVDALLRELVEESIEVRSGFPRLGRAYRMAFVGANGCGKTTLVAKIAHGYRQAGVQVAVLSIIPADPNVAIAGDSRFHGLDIDMRYATTPAQAVQAAETFAAHDLVLVDTPGATYHDPAIRAQVEACLAAVGIDDVNVVLPLATSSREARALVDAFRPLGANRMAVSRIDESRYVGQLLNFGFRLGMPMTFLSEGPRVPDDLRAASAHDIADRILPAHDRNS